MTSSKSETKQNLSQSTPQNKTPHRAEFVSLEESVAKDESFKYKAGQRFNQAVTKILLGWKRRINSSIQGPLIWAKSQDKEKLKDARYSAIIWVTEAAIEGFTANFATHFIIGWDLNIFTVMAHGFAIKQTISIVWRLRKNGSTEPVSEKKR
jgi:hypothetical protein